MERNNKTKAERRELIFEMNYILLMFLTEKNLLEKFIDNCGTIETYSNFNSIGIGTAFVWNDFDEHILWMEADIEYKRYKRKVEQRINNILSVKHARWINKDEWDFNRGYNTKDEDELDR